MEMDTTRPRPNPTAETQTYWNGACQGKLLIQRCTSCGRQQHFPSVICRTCQSTSLEWREAAGTGTVHTLTVVHRAPSAAFASLVPYVLALVDLDEGVRMMANIVHAAPDAVSIGLRVRVVFESLGDNVALPQFEPLGSSRC